MHPNSKFRADADWLDFADARGFAHIFAATSAGPMVVHAPVTRHGSALRFHVARANRAAPHLAGARTIASVASVDGYVSPSWYPEVGDQVPSWNYVAVEFEGPVRQLDEVELTTQLDALAARHEPRLSPAAPWSRAKMDPAVFARMRRGIVGFELTPEAVRETVKLSQHKSPADVAGTIAGLRAAGDIGLADAMERR